MPVSNWVWIKGYEGRYLISIDAEIRSIDQVVKRKFNHGLSLIKGKLLKPSLHNSGYLRINLRKDGKTKSHYLHVLVAKSFLGERPIHHDADHIDGNRLNAKLSNIRWLHRKENRGVPRNKFAAKKTIK